MSAINDGGPAYPVILQSQTDNGVTYHEALTGMSVRDKFAALAMQVLIGQAMTNEGYSKVLLSGADRSLPPEKALPAKLAQNAYGFAEAMLAERAKVPA